MSLSKRLISTGAAAGVVGSDNFSVITYTGTGGAQSTNSLSSQSGTVDFAPDFVWIKGRSYSDFHAIYDTLRGIRNIGTNSTNIEGTNATMLTSFDSNGFSLGIDDANFVNKSSETYVAWCWRAAASTTTIASGTNGSNVISNVRANQAGGFSIVKFGALGAASSIVSHGLSSAPELIIYKNLETADNWYVYTSDTGLGKYLNLNLSGQAITNASNGFTSVNANTFTVNLTTNADDTICYCFHSIADYQSIGTYTGSGSAGKRVYTDSNGDGTGTGGFQPRFVLIKCTTNGSTDWLIFTSNVVDGSGNPTMIRANTTDSQFTGDRLQFTSDGFTLSDNDGSRNGTSRTYLYWAIA